MKFKPFACFFKGLHSHLCQTFCYAVLFSFNLFLVLKTLLVLPLANLTITGLTLPSLGAPNLCVQSRSTFLISSPVFSFKDAITIWSLFSFLLSGSPWINRQFLLEYCSYLFKLTLNDCMVLGIVSIRFCIFSLFSLFPLSFFVVAKLFGY